VASPTIRSLASGNSSGATSHTITYPADCVSGDRFFLVVGADNNAVVTSTGWTQRGVQTRTQSLTVLERDSDSDGTEDSTTFSVSYDTSGECCWVIYCITGAEDGATQAADFASGSSNTSNPNPPSASVTGGPKDILSIASVAYDTGGVSVSGYPTSYTNTGNERNGGASGIGLGFASLGFTNVSAEDPDGFSLSATRNSAYATLLIPEAGGAPATGRPQGPFNHVFNGPFGGPIA
jgi:hypothetical protein